MRRQVRELASLRHPHRGFAELYRASREHGYFQTLQVESEIVGLLQRVKDADCQTLLEIGTAAGGTLFLLTRAASRHALLISLDLAHDRTRAECLAGFARDQQRLELLAGNSNSAETLRTVKDLLAVRPLDFLLIDGDHSRYAVARDFELYGALVAPGGMIAFHDICLEGGVKEFWAALKGDRKTEELIGDAGQTNCGIGILYA
jgi:predicted O-methyltransferase YrrM